MGARTSRARERAKKCREACREDFINRLTHRGKHPIRGYRSWFCRAHQVPYQSKNRRKGLSCIVRMQSYTRITPGSTTKPSDQWIPKKLKTAYRAPWASGEDIFRQWQNLCWRREVAQTSYAWREDTRLLSTWEHRVTIQPQLRRTGFVDQVDYRIFTRVERTTPDETQGSKSCDVKLSVPLLTRAL